MIKGINKLSYKTLCWVKNTKKGLERLGLGPKTLLKVRKFYFHLRYFGLLSSSLFNDIIIIKNNNIEKIEKKFYIEEDDLNQIKKQYDDIPKSLKCTEEEDYEISKQYHEIMKLQEEEEEEDGKLKGILESINNEDNKEILSNFLKKRDKKRADIFIDISLKMFDSLEKLVDSMIEENEEYEEKYGLSYEIDEIDEIGQMDEEERANLNWTEEEIEEFRKEKIEHQLKIKNFNIEEATYSGDEKENERMKELFRNFDNLNDNLDEINADFNGIVDDLNKINNGIEKKERKFYTQQSEGRFIYSCRNKLDIFIIKIWHSKYKNYYIFLITFLNNLFFINLFSGNLFTGNISIIFSAQDVKNIGVAVLQNIDQQNDVGNIDGNTEENNTGIIDAKEEEVGYWDKKVSVLGYETSRKTIAITTGIIVVISIITIGITIWYCKSGGNIIIEQKDDEKEKVINVLSNVQENKNEFRLTNEMIAKKMEDIEDTNVLFEFINYIEGDIDNDHQEFLNSPDYDQIKFNKILKDVCKEQFGNQRSFDNENVSDMKHLYEMAIIRYASQEWKKND